MQMINRPFYLFIFLAIALAGCATFYELNYEFNKDFEAGNLESAEKVLVENKKEQSKDN